MKQLLHTIIFTAICLNTLLSQTDNNPDKSLYHFKAIKINPLRCITDEIPVYYEFSETFSKSWEIKAGIIYPSLLFSEVVVGFTGSPSLFHNGVSAGIARRKYFSKSNSNNYISVAIGYKYKMFNKKTLYLGGWSGSSEADILLLSQNIHTFSIKFITGQMITYNLKTLADIYFGIGINTNYTSTTVHSCKNHQEHTFGNSSFYNNGIYIIPTIHIGIKLGLFTDITKFDNQG